MMATLSDRFKPPVDKPLHDFSDKAHWKDLSSLISPLDPSVFSVIDELSEKFLDGVIEKFDWSKDEDGNGLLPKMMRHPASHKERESSQGLLQDLLAIGIDSDQSGCAGIRPLHTACYGNLEKTASVLLKVGVNAQAADKVGNTPLMAARARNVPFQKDDRVKLCSDVDQLRMVTLSSTNWVPEMSKTAGCTGTVTDVPADCDGSVRVVQVHVTTGARKWYNPASCLNLDTSAPVGNAGNLEKLIIENNGRRPSLAALACNTDFFAVLNLIRRRVVSEGEALGKHQGRNAAEWAEYHEKPRIRDELLYRFPVLKLKDEMAVMKAQFTDAIAAAEQKFNDRFEAEERFKEEMKSEISTLKAELEQERKTSVALGNHLQKAHLFKEKAEAQLPILEAELAQERKISSVLKHDLQTVQSEVAELKASISKQTQFEADLSAAKSEVQAGKKGLERLESSLIEMREFLSFHVEEYETKQAEAANSKEGTTKSLETDSASAVAELTGELENLKVSIQNVSKTAKSQNEKISTRTEDLEAKIDKLEEKIKRDFVSRSTFKYYRDLVLKIRDKLDMVSEGSD